MKSPSALLHPFRAGRRRLSMPLRVLAAVVIGTPSLLWLSRMAVPPPRALPPALHAPRHVSSISLPPRGLARRLARRYHVAPMAIRPTLATIWRWAPHYHIDPWVMTALVGVESRFNPWARSRVGAMGLAQIQPAAHPGFARHHAGMLNPIHNLRWGMRILAECHRRLGNEQLALQCYNGNLADRTARYAHHVMGLARVLHAGIPSRHLVAATLVTERGA